MSKLAALLNMLMSENDGERINAARLLSAVAKKENKTIADLVMSPQTIYRDRIVEKTVYRDRPEDDLRRPKPGPRKREDHPPPDDDLLQGLRWAQNYPQHLNSYESEFIDGVLKWAVTTYELTSRQMKVARRIIAKVKSYEGEPLV